MVLWEGLQRILLCVHRKCNSYFELQCKPLMERNLPDITSVTKVFLGASRTVSADEEDVFAAPMNPQATQNELR